MKNSIYLGLSIVLIFLGPTGCQKNATTKPPLVTVEETNNKTDIKKVVLTEPIKTIEDYFLNEIDLKGPVNLQQIADRLSESQVSQVEEITIIDEGANINSLQGAAAFENLKNLRIDHSQIKDFDGLKGDSKIEELSLIFSKVDSLESLPKKMGIKTLDLNYCPLEDLGDLRQLTELRDLSVCGTKISGLDGEKLPHSLRYLGLRETKIKSLRAIESTFSFVETIDLSHGAVESVDDIKDFGRVQQIGLCNNPVMEQFRDKDGNVPQMVDYKGVSLIFVEPDF